MTQRALCIDRSREMLLASDRLIIRGCQGHKRNHTMLERGYPVFASRAKGPRFWDVDGQEYVDYLMGFGPILLGHGDEDLANAVRDRILAGNIFTVAGADEIDLAEMALSINPWAQMVGFFLGGSAATSSAVRVARAYTGRELVLRCGYHGWHDWTSVDATGVPASARELAIEFPYGDLNVLEDLLKTHDNQVAGVIVETIQHAGPPEGYLAGCIELARKHGAVIVFDEVKTGFRVAYGGATEYYGLQPDLATFGKACCNGLPGSYMVGRREILDSEPVRKCWLAATFHCELLSLVAMQTVLAKMRAADGIAHQWKLGERLIEGVNRICAEHEIAYRLTGLPPMPQPVIEPADAKPRTIRFLLGVLARGHYLHPGHCMFFSLAHDEALIDQTLQAVAEAAEELD